MAPTDALKLCLDSRGQRWRLVLVQEALRFAAAHLLDGLTSGLPGLVAVAVEDVGQPMLTKSPARVFAPEKVASGRVGLDKGHLFLEIMHADALHQAP